MAKFYIILLIFTLMTTNHILAQRCLRAGQRVRTSYEFFILIFLKNSASEKIKINTLTFSVEHSNSAADTWSVLIS